MFRFIFILIFFVSVSGFGQTRASLDSSDYDVLCFHPEKEFLEAWGNLDGIVQEGKWVLFHKSGHISALGKYKKGKRQGKWKFFDYDGVLIEYGRYRKGKKHGIWIVHDDKYVVFDDGLVVDQNVYE